MVSAVIDETLLDADTKDRVRRAAVAAAAAAGKCITELIRSVHR